MNGTNRLLGTVTGNRFAESRRSDIINTIVNPIGMLSKITSTYFKKTYEVQRQNERIEYNRELAGMALPYRNGDRGITI